MHDWTEVGDVPELTQCSGFYDNDTAVIPTAPFSVPGVVGGTNSILAEAGSATAYGPWLSMGAFEIVADRSRLSVGHDPSGALVVSGLTLEAAPSVVSVAGERGWIEHARLTLARPLYPSFVGGEHVVAANDALFIAAIGLAGESRVVRMYNVDPLVLRERSGVWEVDPVELGYDEVDVGQWSLSIDGLEFVDAARLDAGRSDTHAR